MSQAQSLPIQDEPEMEDTPIGSPMLKMLHLLQTKI